MWFCMEIEISYEVLFSHLSFKNESTLIRLLANCYMPFAGKEADSLLLFRNFEILNARQYLVPVGILNFLKYHSVSVPAKAKPNFLLITVKLPVRWDPF